MKPIRYVLRMGFRKNVTLCLFCSHFIITRLQLMMVAKCPTIFFQQEFFTAFLSLKYVGKRKRAKDKENYIIPLTKTILCEKLKALNPYQNKYFICLSEFKHFDIVWQLFLGLQGIIGHRNTSIYKIQLTIIYCNKM